MVDILPRLMQPNHSSKVVLLMHEKDITIRLHACINLDKIEGQEEMTMRCKEEVAMGASLDDTNSGLLPHKR